MEGVGFTRVMCCSESRNPPLKKWSNVRPTSNLRCHYGMGYSLKVPWSGM